MWIGQALWPDTREIDMRHEVDQEILEPSELAKQYMNEKFSTVDDVLQAAKFVVAWQIAREPLLRKAVREIFYERAKINVKPIKKGVKEIDEMELDKGIREITNEEFLKLWIAEQDKLLTISISEKFEGNTSSSFLEEVKELYKRDEITKNVQEWNKLRAECVELALTKMVLPDIRKEIQVLLLREAKDCVLHACSKKIYDWINIAPYQVNFGQVSDDWDSSKGIRVMGVAFNGSSGFAAIVDVFGRLTRILKITTETEFEVILKFIKESNPHVIVIGRSADAMKMKDSFQKVVNEAAKDGSPRIPIELKNDEVAKIYSESEMGIAEFPEYSTLLRQAASLARQLQNPLAEYAQLCTNNEEILKIKYHELQVFFDHFLYFNRFLFSLNSKF